VVADVDAINHAGDQHDAVERLGEVKPAFSLRLAPLSGLPSQALPYQGQTARRREPIEPGEFSKLEGIRVPVLQPTGASNSGWRRILRRYT
jgi:hypothetical protein